jgi:hypothetical protein
MTEWQEILVDRALIVTEGKDTILLDRLPSPVRLIVKNPRQIPLQSSTVERAP